MDVVGVYVMCIVATAYWCNVIVLWNVWVEQSHDFPWVALIIVEELDELSGGRNRQLICCTVA